MELVVDGDRRLPGIEQRFALVESILVLHPLVGADLEVDGFLFEHAFLGDDDRLPRRPRRPRGLRAAPAARDAQLQESESGAVPSGSLRIPRQDEHDENEPAARIAAPGHGDALPDSYLFDAVVMVIPWKEVSEAGTPPEEAARHDDPLAQTRDEKAAPRSPVAQRDEDAVSARP